MNMPTKAQINAAGRHVLTFASGAVAAGAALHVLNPADAVSAGEAINQISSGVASIIAGTTTLIGIASGLYAAWTASPLRQIFAVASTTNSIVVTDDATAKAIPLNNVVSMLETKVVNK